MGLLVTKNVLEITEIQYLKMNFNFTQMCSQERALLLIKFLHY